MQGAVNTADRPFATDLFLFKNFTCPQNVVTESTNSRHNGPTTRLHCTLEVILHHSPGTEHVSVTDRQDGFESEDEYFHAINCTGTDTWMQKKQNNASDLCKKLVHA